MLKQGNGSSICILILVAFGVFVSVLLTGCGMQGADYDRDLVKKSDGLVYKKGDQKPYTGKAYQTVCNDCKCGFFEYAVHWRGEFKNGRKDGIFEFPLSRYADDFFCSGDKSVARIKFIRGVEQGGTDVDPQ